MGCTLNDDTIIYEREPSENSLTAVPKRKCRAFIRTLAETDRQREGGLTNLWRE